MGGNRFCGKLVVKLLHAQGHHVTVFNRSGTAPVSCKIIQGDRNIEDVLRSSFENKKYDCIIDMCLYNLEQAEKSIPIFVEKTKNYDESCYVVIDGIKFEFNTPLNLQYENIKLMGLNESSAANLEKYCKYTK